MTAFLIGTASGQREELPGESASHAMRVVAAVALCLLWPALGVLVEWKLTFPFWSVPRLSAQTSAILVSIAISFS